MKSPALLSIRCLLAAFGLVSLAGPLSAANWPAWRGADGNGISAERNLPLKWSATENVRWKIPLPDRGNSTPVVWGDKVFVTQAIEKEHRRTLMCFARRDGKMLWQQGVTYAEAEETHETNPYCSASPATDGERVIVCHGSAGVICYDLNGRELWKRDLGKQQYGWGNGSSPVLHGDACFLYFGPGKGAFLVALDKRTGKTLWKYDEQPITPGERTDGFRGSRNGMICSYSTPLVIRAGGRDEVVMSFPQFVRAFDPKTGRELWHCDGLNPLVYASPVYGEGTLVAMGGYLGNSIAVKTGGAGDVTASHRLWQTVRTKNRLGTGVVHDGHVYILNSDGIAECLELKTGRTVWSERVKGPGATGDSWSSMLLAGDRIYVPNQSGDTIVLRAGPKFELLAANSLGAELTNASLAVSDGLIFIRTHKNLWCIGEVQTAAR